MKGFYLLQTKGCGEYYAIVDNIKDAGDKLTKRLNEENIKSAKDRKILSFKILAQLTRGHPLTPINSPDIDPIILIKRQNT